jgi:hypothetical protein
MVDALIALICGGGIWGWIAYLQNSPRSLPPPLATTPSPPVYSPPPAATPYPSPAPRTDNSLRIATPIPFEPAFATPNQAADQAHKQSQIIERKKALEQALVDLASHRKNMARMRADLDAGVPSLYNMIAWHWATCKTPGHANPVMAIRICQENIAAMPEESWYVDTLAAAYARVGNFAAAIQTQEKAISLAHAGELKKKSTNYEWRMRQMQHRLGAYRERHWWSEDADKPPVPIP